MPFPRPLTRGRLARMSTANTKRAISQDALGGPENSKKVEKRVKFDLPEPGPWEMPTRVLVAAAKPRAAVGEALPSAGAAKTHTVADTGRTVGKLVLEAAK